MKVRWREHELIFVTILMVAEVMLSIKTAFEPAQKGAGAAAIIFQSCTILLFYGAYISINLLIIPSIKKITFSDIERPFTPPVLRAEFLLALTGFLLALGANIISYYAKPHLVNYGGYQLLALMGYNDKPLTNIFFGFDRGIGLVILFTALAGLREFITWLIEKPGPSRQFRVMVMNNVVPLVFLYFLALYFINPIHARFMDYMAWFTPALALYIYETFWLFPSSQKVGFWHQAVRIRLMLACVAGAVVSTLFFSGENKLAEFSAYFLFLLLVVTPLAWLLYQQRRDKILQLKGMEAQLAKSASDLQFLRSQINPHFLFNALNTLYGTAIKEKSEQTAEGIQRLGDMMRFMLHENNLDFIHMDKEIEYLKNYIALQKLRIPFSGEIRVDHNIDEVTCNRTIAPMLLIPLVENAFKHGISLQEKSWIDIKLDCNETFLCFEVRNSIHRLQLSDTEKDRSGIGLKNVAERLQLLYTGKHELQVSQHNNEFIARLVIT